MKWIENDIMGTTAIESVFVRRHLKRRVRRSVSGAFAFARHN